MNLFDASHKPVCMGRHYRRVFGPVAVLIFLFPLLLGWSMATWAAALEKEQVLMLRHALAPGTGDPSAFRIGDCSTQRNLNDEGRMQARRLGDSLRAAGLSRARVYSSQWCRCLETARLLNLGPVAELPALNSFFDRAEDRDERIAALRRFLAGLPLDGEPVVLVTHQVTITAVSGVFPGSGTGVILRLDGSGNPPLARVFTPD
jgi:broad specificity phosphatase PhoE